MSLNVTFTEPATVNTAGAFLAAGAVKDPGHGLWVYLGFRSPGNVASVQTSPDLTTWTMHNMPSASTWRAIAYAATLGTGGRLVAVGNGVAAWSDDGGVTWAAATSLPEANNWVDVKWWEARSIFVMVAASGAHRVGTSSDGKSWTMQTAAAASSWSGVEVSETVAVAVTNSSSASTQQVMTSADGATWTLQTHASIKTDQGTVSSGQRHGIGYSPDLDMFLITGTDGGGVTKAYRSTDDGVTWTASGVIPTISDTTKRGYIWVTGQNAWYLSCANLTYGQSKNGVAWTVRTLPASHSGYTPIGWDRVDGVLVGGSTLGFDTVLVGVVAGGGEGDDAIELPPIPYRSPAVQPGVSSGAVSLSSGGVAAQPSGAPVGGGTALSGGGTLHIDYIKWLNLAKDAIEHPASVVAAEIVGGQPLSKVDDTNVTITLGGTPSTALLAAVSLTMGWAGTLSAARGGTGLGSYAVGDLLYADTTSTLARLADVAAGAYLRSGGVSTAPLWSALVLPNAATSGDILKASGANVYASVAPAALTKTDDTNVTATLGGSATTALVNAASITLGWTGQLAVPRGGTGANSFATNGILFGAAGAAIQALAVNATGTKMFLTQSNSNPPAWGQVAGTDLTGTTLASNVTISSLNSSTTTRSSGANATAMTWADTVTGVQTAGFGLQLRWNSNAGGSVSAIGLEVGGTGTNNESQIAFYTQNSAGSLTRRGTWKSDGGLKIESATSGTSTDVLENRSSVLYFNGSQLALAAHGGTTGTIAKFTSATAIGNSLVTESGTTVTVGGSLGISVSATWEQKYTVNSVLQWQWANTTYDESGNTQSDAIFSLSRGVNLSSVFNVATGSIRTFKGLDDKAYTEANQHVLAGANQHALGIAGSTTLCNINFYVKAVADRKATIQAAVDGSNGGSLRFYTKPDGSSLSGESMRIFASTGISIGDTTDPGSTNLRVVGGLTLLGKITKYNNITTAGWGLAAIYGSGRSTAQTAAVASVATYTLGAADGSFLVSGNVNVTISTTHSFSIKVDYVDEGNASRTLTLDVTQLDGTSITAITNTTGVGPYHGVPVQIRCKASTTITIKTTGTFTSVTYNVEGTITRVS